MLHNTSSNIDQGSFYGVMIFMIHTKTEVDENLDICKFWIVMNTSRLDMSRISWIL